MGFSEGSKADTSYREFVSWVEVVYGENRPDDAVSEIYGGNSDINKGRGGEYVWLRVHRADRPGPLINNFWITIGGEQGGKKDLAKGAGGDYRYLDWSTDKVDCPVTEVGLWRCDSKQDWAPNGWQGKSDDVNRGRGGDYLYVVWKVKRYNGPR